MRMLVVGATGGLGQDVVADTEAQEQVVHASDLDFVLVRPLRFAERRPRGSIRVIAQAPVGAKPTDAACEVMGRDHEAPDSAGPGPPQAIGERRFNQAVRTRVSEEAWQTIGPTLVSPGPQPPATPSRPAGGSRS